MAADVDNHDPLAQLLTRQGRGCCNDQQLDALILGEADAADADALRAHLEASPTCLARHDELRAGHDEWRRSAPPLPVPTATVTSLANRRWPARLGIAGGLAAAAVVVFAIVVPNAGGDDVIVRTKGTPLKAGFATASGADLYDGDSIALPASLVIALSGRSDGVIAVEARDVGADWHVLTGPVPYAQTLRAMVPATTAARIEVRVVACDDVDALVGDRSGCVVDGLTVVRRP